MATCLKTIAVPFATNVASLASATARDLTATIYIPETVGEFRNVSVLVNCRAVNATAVNATAPAIQVQLGAAGFSSYAALPNPIAQSGEHESWIFAKRMADYFTTNWSGTSMACTVRFQVSGPATANHGVIMYITYTYDDTAATQIKTVYIPLESKNQYITTSWATCDNIPQLTSGGLLPENGATIRNSAIVLFVRERSTSTTDCNLSFRFDGSGTTQCWYGEQALSGNGLGGIAIVDTSALSATAAHTFELTSSVANGFVWSDGGYMIITYEFTLSGTTTVLNSLVMGAMDDQGWMGGTASTAATGVRRQVFIQEPTTITLQRSGIVLIWNDSTSAVTVNIKIGTQSYRAYAGGTASTLDLCSFFAVQRFDSGGVQGAGVSLARGRNNIDIWWYSGTASGGWGVNGLCFLNYTSAVASAGIGSHNHSCHWFIDEPTGGYTQTSPAFSIDIPQSFYWLVSFAPYFIGTTDNATNQSASLSAEIKSGEGMGAGWEPMGVTQFRSDNENVLMLCYLQSRKSWKRWPGDPDSDRLDLETSRTWRFDSTMQIYAAFGLWVTFHTITYSISGSISASGSGTVQLALMRVDSKEVVLTGSRSGDGSYSFTWGDNTEDVTVVAIEDDTHTGVSKQDVAGT